MTKKTTLKENQTLAHQAQQLLVDPRPEGRGRCAVLLVLLLAGVMVLGLAGSALTEPQRPKGTGMLTEVRANGTVIIDERGYYLSPHVIVLDSQGKRTSLDRFSLPTKVSYEYMHTVNGVEIRLMKEIAQ